MMNIYVGNLSYDTRDSDLEHAFSAYGTVDSARVIMDRDTNRSKGFGFVEMDSKDSGDKAIAALDGTDLQGRTIKVNEARPRETRESRPPRRY
jgi:RNA recognition motif-containing protein